MTTYYASPDGSDSNNGLGPDASHATNKPWLTIGKALGASGVPGGSGGHTLKIAPGTYRETVTPALTTPTVELVVTGDVANASGFKNSSGVLRAGGDVVLTAYTTNDTTTPASAATLNTAAKNYLTFENLIIVGGNATGSCVSNGGNGGSNITFRRCVFIGYLGQTVVDLTALTTTSTGRRFDQCVFFGSNGSSCVYIELATVAGADYDVDLQITNSLLLCPTVSMIRVLGTGANSFKGGGVDLWNCTINNDGYGLRVSNTSISTSIPCTVYNCLLSTGSTDALIATTSGQITEDYNRILSTTPRTNVTAGANSLATGAHALLVEVGQAWINGAAPRPFFMPMDGSPLLGRGTSGSVSLTVDMLNRARPSGGQSTSKAWGAMERHDTAAKETTTVRTGSTGINITGPGDHEFAVPVDATSTTISVYARYDTTHAATNKPQMLIVNGGECGVADATATMTAAADTWEQLSLNFTPTQKGVVTVRLVSRAAGGSGKAFFDDFAVS